MSFRYKSLQSVNEEDLIELITNKVSEAKYLDFKQKLPENDDKSKREFLADVSSFANAVGGHLIYGLEEDEGVPLKLTPLKGNPDADILRLESMILNGIRPRIAGIDTHEVPCKDGYVIIIWVPPSANALHMVTFSGHDKFYSRSSRGKYPLTVDEIRMGFIQSETTVQKIRDYRQERCRIIDNNLITPVKLQPGPKLVLHLVPIEAFRLAEGIDIKEMIAKKGQLRPMGGWACNYRTNFDGYLGFIPDPSEPSPGYVQ
ncbi:MAG: ATP-binding protein, partial [Candidatus Thorarchaeota archaeon]